LNETAVQALFALPILVNLDVTIRVMSRSDYSIVNAKT
jgi:hypothetical protein